MRTQEEIVTRIREKRDVIFGFEAEVLLPHLDYEHAKEFLKPEASREQWEGLHRNGDVEERYPLTEAAALRDFRSYAEFAWGKAADHRGLSAGRSVEKLTAWAWLLGRDDVLVQVEKTDYAQYGCPKLKVICEAFGFPIPDDEGSQRMMRGEPCVVGCDMGCGP